MPIDPVTGTLITAGVSGLVSGGNSYAQGRMNKKTREFSREMYAKQKQDNLDYWHMQNDYNDPQSQMQRLKDAGLNPNMVYGASAPGNSSGQVHSATPPAWSPKAPQFDVGSPLASYFNIATQSATLDNIKATNTKIQAETRAILANAGLRESELRFAPDFFNNRQYHMGNTAQLSSLKADYEHWRQNPDMFPIDNPNFKESQAYKESALKLQNLGIDNAIKRAISEGKSLDNIQKNLDNELRKNGINPNDPLIMRIIGRIVADHFSIKNFF